MEMIENKQTQKRRMPKVGTMILAAALAVGCVLSIAAGLPAQVYNYLSGGSVTVMPGTSSGLILTGDGEHGPVTAENGRLYFETGEEKLDITDKVDESTPYIYERTDPATGNKGYVVVGGTVDNYGWAEFFLTEDGSCSMLGENAYDYMVPIDGELVPMNELTEAQMDALNEDGGVGMKTINRPWLDAALSQLELEGHFVG